MNVASRYAKALLAATKQKGVHEQALAQLKAVDQALNSDPQLKEFFENPVVSPDQKTAAIKGAFSGKGFLDEVVNCLLLMAERGRLAGLTDLVHAFQDSIDEENGVTRGVVRAAKPLTPEAQTELEKKITQVLKKKIVLTFKEDPTLLGGVVAQVGGWTFDDSIETHLKKMNEELNRSAY
jgi:F-type H+-transporting ATPase subunit delta